MEEPRVGGLSAAQMLMTAVGLHAVGGTFGIEWPFVLFHWLVEDHLKVGVFVGALAFEESIVKRRFDVVFRIEKVHLDGARVRRVIGHTELNGIQHGIN